MQIDNRSGVKDKEPNILTRGEKIRKSARGAVGSRDLAVRTQKIDGSM